MENSENSQSKIMNINVDPMKKIIGIRASAQTLHVRYGTGGAEGFRCEDAEEATAAFKKGWWGKENWRGADLQSQYSKGTIVYDRGVRYVIQVTWDSFWNQRWLDRMTDVKRNCKCGSHEFLYSESGTDSEVVGSTQFAGGIPPASCLAADSIHESVKRADGVIRGILVVLRHHGATHPVVDSFVQQARDYLVHPDEKVFFKRAKYLTVAPMARFLKQEPPKVPDLAWKPIGQFGKWAKHRLSVYCRRNIHLWYSFLQAKRAALPLSEALVLTTYEEHRKAMEIVDPIDDSTHDSVMKLLEPVLKKVSAGIRAKLSSAGASLDHTPSNSACFEETRSKGGQAAVMRRLVPEIELYDEKRSTRDRRLPTLARMVFHPILYQNGVVRYNVVVEEYEYPDGERLWKDSVQKESLRYKRVGRLECIIQAVIEPLKIRVISKGEAVPYYFSKDLQRAIHGTMRDMPCFRLIGRPLCPTDLIDLASNRCILGKGRYEWFSIDYSAATDNLSARLSASILERLTRGFDESTRALWSSVLAPHHCSYPELKAGCVEDVDQRNGQLMGSILSFPVLCLANLGLYLETIKEDTRPLRDRLRGVLVNGDDMLYVAKHSKWNDHILTGEKVGLVMSAGKAYCHSRYANANSACFDYDLYRSNATPWSIPFLNTGLYFGQSKVLADDKGERDEGFCSTVNRLLQGALPGKDSELMRQFVARHSSWIEQECRGRNLFVPQALGGMGVTRPLGFETKFTWQQRAVAMKRVNEQPYGWLGAGPLPAGDVPERSEIIQPWISKEVEKRKDRLTSRATFDLLSMSKMELPFRVCLKRASETRPCYGRQKRRLAPEFQLWKDAVQESLELQIHEDSSVNSSNTAWTVIGRQLDFCLLSGVTLDEALEGMEGSPLF